MKPAIRRRREHEALTRKGEDGQAAWEPQALESGAAAQRLMCFEDFHEHLQRRKEQIPLELEALRAQNKAKTYRFRELMTEHLTNEMALGLLGMFEVKE